MRYQTKRWSAIRPLARRQGFSFRGTLRSGGIVLRRMHVGGLTNTIVNVLVFRKLVKSPWDLALGRLRYFYAL